MLLHSAAPTQPPQAAPLHSAAEAEAAQQRRVDTMLDVMRSTHHPGNPGTQKRKNHTRLGHQAPGLYTRTGT